MSTDLLLDSLVVLGFALNNTESTKQTQLLKEIHDLQKQSIYGHSTPERTDHQNSLIEKASGALKEKDYETALSYAERLINLEKKDPNYYILRGDCLTRLGKISEAIDNYDTSLDLNDKIRYIPSVYMEHVKDSINILEEVQKTIRQSLSSVAFGDIVKLIDEVKINRAKTADSDRAKLSAIQVEIQNGVEAYYSNRPINPQNPLYEVYRSRADTYIKRLVLYSVCINSLSKLPSNQYWVKLFVVRPRIENFNLEFVVNDCTIQLAMECVPSNNLHKYVLEEKGFSQSHQHPERIERTYGIDEIYDVALNSEEIMCLAIGKDAFEIEAVTN